MINMPAGPEIMVILLLALLVLGPDQLPKAMRTFGNFMAEVRKVSSSFQTEMREALEIIEEGAVPEDLKTSMSKDESAASDTVETTATEHEPGGSDKSPADDTTGRRAATGGDAGERPGATDATVAGGDPGDASDRREPPEIDPADRAAG